MLRCVSSSGPVKAYRRQILRALLVALRKLHRESHIVTVRCSRVANLQQQPCGPWDCSVASGQGRAVQVTQIGCIPGRTLIIAGTLSLLFYQYYVFVQSVISLAQWAWILWLPLDARRVVPQEKCTGALCKEITKKFCAMASMVWCRMRFEFHWPNSYTTYERLVT